MAKAREVGGKSGDFPAGQLGFQPEYGSRTMAPLPATDAKPRPPVARIKSIKGCGSFGAFKWQDSVPDLHRLVVIYGGNGSGKTTLSSVFAEMEMPGGGALPPGASATIVLRMATGEEREVQLPGTEVGLPPVRVYSTTRTSQYLGTIDQGSLPVNLVLGRGQPELQEKLDETRKAAQRLGTEASLEQKKTEAADKRIEKHASETAKQIKEQLRILAGYANFNRAKVEDLWKTLAFERQSTSVADLASLQRQATEGVGVKQPLIDDLSKASTLIGSLKSLTIPPGAATMPGERRAWIVEGIKLHAAAGDGQLCFYCENEVTSQRKERLEAILYDETTKFHSVARDLMLQCQAMEAACRAVRLPDSAAIRDAVRTPFSTDKARFEKANTDLVIFLETTRLALGKSLETGVLGVPDMTAMVATWQAAAHACNGHLETHNWIVDNHQKESTGAADRFALALAANALVDVAPDLEEKTTASKILQELRERLEQTNASVRALEDARITPEISAQELTRDLAAYFGRQEFEVRQNPSNPKFYQLLRNGDPVTRLSDGERRAISFVYFLETLRAHDFAKESGVVVIDDPVNSMDEQAVYHAQHFVRERCHGVAQAIVLTHNFPFFRLLKRDALNRKEGESSLLMVSAAGNPRQSTIGNLDPLLRDFESDYHFLFYQIWKVANTDTGAGESGNMTEFMHIPNQARRVLEAFGAFVFPANSSVSAADTLEQMVARVKEDAKHHVKEAAKSAGAIKALLNHGSHQAAVGGHDPDPAVIIDCPVHMKSLLALMKHISYEHVDGMETKCRRRDADGEA